MGDVVLTELLAARGRTPQRQSGPKVYFIIEDESLRAKSLACIQNLRQLGICTDFPLTPSGSGKQFKRAAESGFHFTAKLASEGPESLVIKNLLTREEKTLPESEAFAHLMAVT